MMAIISARHKCPECGREWSMPVNTGSADQEGAEEAEKAMKENRMRLETVCEACRSRAGRRERR